MPSTLNPITRAMTHDDVAHILPLEQACHTSPWSAGHFHDSLEAQHYMPLLQATNGAALGYLVAMPGVDEAHLLNITIDPIHRRQGLGSQLMHHLHAWARTQAAMQVWLEVRQSNLAAQTLYTRIGYEHIAVRKNYYRTKNGHEHALIMRKLLP